MLTTLIPNHLQFCCFWDINDSRLSEVMQRLFPTNTFSRAFPLRGGDFQLPKIDADGTKQVFSCMEHWKGCGIMCLALNGIVVNMSVPLETE